MLESCHMMVVYPSYSDRSRLVSMLKRLLQVFHLKEAGIACGYLSGTQEYAESRELLQGLGRDPPAVKILFVTPEKVARSDYLMRTLDGLHARNLLVMHCLTLLTSLGSAPCAGLPPLSKPGSSVCLSSSTGWEKLLTVTKLHAGPHSCGRGSLCQSVG